MKWWDQMPWSLFAECWALSGDATDAASVSGSGRSPGEGNGKPLQYPCLENSMDRGAWLARVHRVAKIQTWLSTQAQTYVGRSGQVILSVSVHLFQEWSRNLNPGLFRLSFKAMIFSEAWSGGLRRSLLGFYTKMLYFFGVIFLSVNCENSMKYQKIKSSLSGIIFHILIDCLFSFIWETQGSWVKK